MKHIETVVIGAGQSGLATSYFLKQFGGEHVVLEQSDRPANVWTNQRWDSFTLVTPNWATRIPGLQQSRNDPDGFMPRDQIIRMFEQYADQFQLPIQYNTRVHQVQPRENKGYLVQTEDETLHCDHVVVATGFYQKPNVPLSALAISKEILQLPSSSYRNPEALPPGAVLVVGSGQSGCQIAEELYQSGRKVFLCTGSAGRAPRRYRGKDVIDWLNRTGFFARTPDQLPPGMGKFKGIPHLSGKDGGHAINLHKFVQDGVILLGHFLDASNSTIHAAANLYENLEKADQFEIDATQMIDDFIDATGIKAPEEELPQLKYGFQQDVIEKLDCKSEGITSIIWAIGFQFDYSLIKLPVQDSDGFPIQSQGISPFPGLYFVGMPWMPGENTGFLIGFADTSKQIVARIIGARDVAFESAREV